MGCERALCDLNVQELGSAQSPSTLAPAAEHSELVNEFSGAVQRRDQRHAAALRCRARLMIEADNRVGHPRPAALGVEIATQLRTATRPWDWCAASPGRPQARKSLARAAPSSAIAPIATRRHHVPHRGSRDRERRGAPKEEKQIVQSLGATGRRESMASDGLGQIARIGPPPTGELRRRGDG